MKKIDSLNQVAEFHRTFNAPILDTPQIPLDRAELRINLLQEHRINPKEIARYLLIFLFIIVYFSIIDFKSAGE